MTIRCATERDIPGCAELLDLLFSQEQEFTPDRAVQERGLSMIVNDSSAGKLFVCERDGKIVGMVNLLFTVSTALGCRVAILEDMVVSPAHRNAGIGSGLIGHACDWAKREGFGRITLLTDGDNEAAQRFYVSKGFDRSEMTVFRKRL